MYLAFLETITAYIAALNATCATVDETGGLRPYLNNIPVYLDGEVVGHLVDELDGEFSYVPAVAVSRG